ncbi:MAG TPA: AmmeMemoRadiSam system protein A [Thermoanaerobaculia bacterium]|nr:AmmeMemoRadiSam system protein A [Thermoanaerobaculia bacterium]
MPAEPTAPATASAAAAAAGSEQGRLLLALAREAIAAVLYVPWQAVRVPAAELAAPWLRAPGACFVTLTQDGRLRGCIGSVRARRPLADDVCANARAAALSDPRFPPLTAVELPATRIEVSLLSAPTPLPAASEEEALATLRPGIDGVILELGGESHATFLPQVWDNLPSPRDFLAHLKHKAGLPVDFWSPDLRLQRYTVIKWSEPGPPADLPT